VGLDVGTRDGFRLGALVGRRLGLTVGSFVGFTLGLIDGTRDGFLLGAFVGRSEGLTVGAFVGLCVGLPVPGTWAEMWAAVEMVTAPTREMSEPFMAPPPTVMLLCAMTFPTNEQPGETFRVAAEPICQNTLAALPPLMITTETGPAAPVVKVVTMRNIHTAFAFPLASRVSTPAEAAPRVMESLDEYVPALNVRLSSSINSVPAGRPCK
jgi:hypothetical protein